MRLSYTDRGFEIVTHPEYSEKAPARLVQMSSAVGVDDLDNGNPGTSYLWIGSHHHLNRDEVEELCWRLEHWLHNGTLRLPLE